MAPDARLTRAQKLRRRLRRVAVVGISCAAGWFAAGCGVAQRAVIPAPKSKSHQAHTHRVFSPGELLPKGDGIYAGVTGGATLKDYNSFARAVHSHPPVWDQFVDWYGNGVHGISRYIGYWLAQARQNNYLLMLTFAPGVEHGKEFLSPADVGKGEADQFLIALSTPIAQSGQPVYIRPYGEMNQSGNGYDAYTAGGAWRGPQNSQEALKQAWRRMVVVMRGGAVTDVNRELHRLGLPPVRTALTTLPRADVSFVWCPQVAGNPDIPGNSPMAYWPGSRWVNWVGTDFYSGFPNWSGLNAYHTQVRQFHKPFAVTEFGIYSSGDDPAFIRTFIEWSKANRDVHMVLYNQGYKKDGPMTLQHNPRSAAALRNALSNGRFQQHVSGR